MFQVGDKVRLIDQDGLGGVFQGTLEVIKTPAMTGNYYHCSHPIDGVTAALEREIEMAPLPIIGLKAFLTPGAHAPSSNNPFIAMIKQHNAANADRIIPIVYGIPALKKCECGAESLGYMTHSTWCAKHER